MSLITIYLALSLYVGWELYNAPEIPNTDKEGN